MLLLSSLFFLFLGALTCILFSWMFHLKNNKGSSLIFKKNAIYIFTLDYFFAKKYKPDDRKKKSDYIKLMNSNNIILTLIIFDILIVLNYFDILIVFNILLLLKYLIGFIGYRCISRSLELIISFGNDAINPKKSSILNAEDRVKLAINSYIEVVLNYAVFYYLLNVVEPPKIDPINLITSLYKSIGISTFSGIGTSQLGIFSSLHLFTSFVLVVFAIAVYLSSIGEEHKEREVSKALLKSKKSKRKKIGEYLESDEYKFLGKRNLTLNDLKAYKKDLIKDFNSYKKKRSNKNGD